ncbi:MAG: A/G-specific adenine glycosylase [Actinobacteria bacterium]|jgi:A/G-specific adenine glycosylase|nr:A/G-specific adenine glycosylase [Actinomycetota bacterium]NCV42768.1 A/G-specific adenine glycosylase [Actinomycetota bacterium]NCV82495.1 A/G-specific adenine glycosylase [Actinomycetota bacterium]NCW42647.1 A/G-specific adenine glycosylase [Actinomycetota bacterium]NCW72160.1 A/G-specific adenine glycosylase [Actinomycetota bacterium]
MNQLEKPIVSWFKKNKRDLPWRNTTPWGVMVSEYMLQQTPVNRVLPKWDEWMKRWPTPKDLAKASPAEVITAWGRLGYPRRALRLHAAAQIISEDFKNQVPEDSATLQTLPGIGEYTAAAIGAFAFEKQTLVMDVNIRRLLTRIIDGNEHPRPAPTTREKASRLALQPPKNAHIWAAATMELGALVCTSKNPICEQCPVIGQCKWRKNGYPKTNLVRKSQDWHGTDRKCRGTIVQALRENESLTENAIKKLWPDESQVEKALKTLQADLLIEAIPRKRYRLPA